MKRRKFRNSWFAVFIFAPEIVLHHYVNSAVFFKLNKLQLPGLIPVRMPQYESVFYGLFSKALNNGEAAFKQF